MFPIGSMWMNCSTARTNTRFDLIVRALPGTSTTSLEGGTLWTTELRIRAVEAEPHQTLDPAGRGRGEIFVNPFANVVGTEEERSRTSVNTLVGRVLNGGTMTRDMPLFLHLRTPSHSRSRAIADAINSSFPVESGQRAPTAVPVTGQSDERIQITVPPSWSGRTEEFVEVLMHTPIYQAGAEVRADALRRWLMENPVDAPSVSWSFVAIGARMVPEALEAMQRLYDYPEIAPRLAALKAGAKLEDPLTIPHLEALARQPDHEFRLEAIELLADLPNNPRSHTVLRDLLGDRNADVRIAAFEGLLRNDDPVVVRHAIGSEAKFNLYSVPSERPMVYIRQEGEPMVVIFGHDLSIRQPVLASAWGTRFMMMNEDPEKPLRVFYENPRTGSSEIYEPSERVPAFVRFLARSGSFRGEAPGLGMNYSQTVSVLYALHEEEALGGPLVLQQDRVAQAISRERDRRTAAERPETNLRFGDDEVPGPGDLDPPAPVEDEAPSRPETSNDRPGRPESSRSDEGEGGDQS